MTWRLAYSLVSLRNAINAKWPDRDKTSDGTIGDAAHATRVSDHNPWIIVDGVGVVRAMDIDVDGIDASWYAEQLRLLGAAGDHRLTDGGYVIYNRRITKSDFTGWQEYTGTNPHTGHVHLSVSRNQVGFDDGGPWKFLLPATPATPEQKRRIEEMGYVSVTMGVFGKTGFKSGVRFDDGTFIDLTADKKAVDSVQACIEKGLVPFVNCGTSEAYAAIAGTESAT